MLPRVVLDTNVLVSALLFPQGSVGKIRNFWQDQWFLPLVNHHTASELIHVLTYPKFKLTADEREKLLADFLPYTEVIIDRRPEKTLPKLRDADDVKFLALALAGRADVLVSGDKHLLEIKPNDFSVSIQTPLQFLSWLEKKK